MIDYGITVASAAGTIASVVSVQGQISALQTQIAALECQIATIVGGETAEAFAEAVEEGDASLSISMRTCLGI